MKTKYKYLSTLLIFFLHFTEAICQQQSPIVIEGKVTHLDAPIPNVNIIVEGSELGTETDSNGRFSLSLNKGDILLFSHMSYKTLRIKVVEPKRNWSIKMDAVVHELDETVVTSKRKQPGKVEEEFQKRTEKFRSAYGVVDPKAAGYAIKYVDGKDISSMYGSLTRALLGKVSGFDVKGGFLYLRGGGSINNPRSVLWDVDGFVYTEEPPIDLNSILDVRVIPSLAGTALYGTLGAGGVVVVRTKYGTFLDKTNDKENVAKAYYNQAFYGDDALAVNSENLYLNAFTEKLLEFTTAEMAFSHYRDSIMPLSIELGDQIAMARNMFKAFGDPKIFKSILNEQVELHKRDPVALRAIAYQYQEWGMNSEALDIYRELARLLPNSPQSYRDLGNCYMDNGNFAMAWRVYMANLLRDSNIIKKDIGEIIYSEMEQLHFNHKDGSTYVKRFVPNHGSLSEFRNDVRLLFEWNDPDSEFILEFVGPERRSFSFEHTYSANPSLFEKGENNRDTSKQFFIDSIGGDQWMVNLDVKEGTGNGFLKMTIYYNWGGPGERKEIAVFNLKNIGYKVQLLNLNAKSLLAQK